ncbi:MAG: class I SAM-dependent methyltransferase [Propionibacteriaceae bacterium]
MDYYPFLAEIHRRLAPRTYLEIGVREGGSLSLARCRSVAIDPAFSIRFELDGDVALFRTTSDEYFARSEPLAPTNGTPFDLAFIDGLHLFEYAFRDFVNAERHSSPRGVIIFDDILPRTIDEAARGRHTRAWTGDVYPMLAVLAHYRPDLIVVPVGTQPTGLLFVLGLDPDNTVLSDNYHQIMADHRHADPQPVPAEVLDRLTVLPPERLLQAGVLDLLGRAARDATVSDLREPLRAAVSSELGVGYARQPV